MTPDEIEAYNEHLRSLGPLDPSTFPFSELPPPTSASAFCKLTALRTGEGHGPKQFFISPAKEGEISDVPCFAFLIEKTKEDGESVRVMFELGIREVGLPLSDNKKTRSTLMSFVRPCLTYERSRWKSSRSRPIERSRRCGSSGGIREVQRRSSK